MNTATRTLGLLALVCSLTLAARAATPVAVIASADPAIARQVETTPMQTAIATDTKTAQNVTIAYEATGDFIEIANARVELYKLNVDGAASLTAADFQKNGFRIASTEEMKAWTLKFGEEKMKNPNTRLLVKQKLDQTTASAQAPSAPASGSGGR